MRQNTLLRNTLLANAIFSLLCGLDAILFNQFFMNLFGISNSYVFPILGGGLLLFCVTVFLEARRREVKRPAIRAIIGQDVGWVAGSILIIATNVFSFSSAGLWLTAGVAVIVAVFALLQYQGIKKAI